MNTITTHYYLLASIIIVGSSTTVHGSDYSETKAMVERMMAQEHTEENLVPTYIEAIKNGNYDWINSYIRYAPSSALQELKKHHLLFLIINTYQNTIFNPSLAERARMSRYNQVYNTLMKELARQGVEVITQRLIGEIQTRCASAGTQVLWTMLYPSVEKLTRYEDTAKALLSWGLADANETNIASGQTVLMRTAELGWTGLASILLQYNANRLVTDKSGRTALMVAIDNNHTDVAKNLLRTKEELREIDSQYNGILPSSITKGLNAHLQNVAHSAIVQQLNSAGNAVWGTISRWWQPEQNQHIPLVKKRNDPFGIHITDSQGNTPLCYAIKKQTSEIVPLLLEKGALTDQSTEYINTILSSALTELNNKPFTSDAKNILFTLLTTQQQNQPLYKTINLTHYHTQFPEIGFIADTKTFEQALREYTTGSPTTKVSP